MLPKGKWPVRAEAVISLEHISDAEWLVAFLNRADESETSIITRLSMLLGLSYRMVLIRLVSVFGLIYSAEHATERAAK